MSLDSSRRSSVKKDKSGLSRSLRGMVSMIRDTVSTNARHAVPVPPIDINQKSGPSQDCQSMCFFFF